jgi:hypothetical protein
MLCLQKQGTPVSWFVNCHLQYMKIRTHDISIFIYLNLEIDFFLSFYLLIFYYVSTAVILLIL